MARFIIHWLTVTLALAATAWLLNGVHIVGWAPLLIGSLVLGLLNATIRPIMAFLTFPITVLTLGLFYLVVNGISFGLAAWFVPGFFVDSFFAAISGALVCSVLSWVIGWFTGDGRDRREQRERRQAH